MYPWATYSRTLGKLALLACCGSVAASRASATVLLTVEEALDLAFPGCGIARNTVFPTSAEIERAERASGEPLPSAVVVRYVATRNGELVGTAYFDTHRVRTLDETVMVVVAADGSVGRVEVVSFAEPMEYMPREGWYRQFDGKALDDALRLDREIRAVSGATLTATATTAATRRVLALHRVIEEREAP